MENIITGISLKSCGSQISFNTLDVQIYFVEGVMDVWM